MGDEWSEYLLNRGWGKLADVMTSFMRATLPERCVVAKYAGEHEAIVESFMEDAEGFTGIEDAHNSLEELLWMFLPPMHAAMAMSRLDDVALGMWCCWVTVNSVSPAIGGAA